MIPPRVFRLGTTLAVVALLAACASRPPARDGADPNPPSGLDRVPDAEPRVETIRPGGANKPYEVLGERYVPLATDGPLRESGLASWYGRKFHGKPTSSGEPYDMYAMTAAHKTMPLPSYARVRNPANGREIVVRVNDRGPFAAGRIIDLSYTAALKLGVLGGVAPVVVERITHDEIRAGTWRRGPGPSTTMPPPELPSEEDPLLALAQGAGSAQAVPRAGVWLQLGAYGRREGAQALLERLRREASDIAVTVFEDRTTFRVQAGPFASRSQASGVAERLKGLLQLVPLVVERPAD